MLTATTLYNAPTPTAQTALEKETSSLGLCRGAVGAQPSKFGATLVRSQRVIGF